MTHHPFEPFIAEESRVLVLGSFPSLASFEYGFYYGHPKNQFWPLLSRIFQEKTESLEEKKALLQKYKIALWDAAASCERKNSSDANLKLVEPNDIGNILNKYPNIEKIFFTGKMAEKIFQKRFKHLSIDAKLLPSPSPAYAAVNFEQKLEIYREELSFLNSADYM